MNQYEEDIEQSVEQARYASKKKKKRNNKKADPNHQKYNRTPPKSQQWYQTNIELNDQRINQYKPAQQFENFLSPHARPLHSHPPSHPPPRYPAAVVVDTRAPPSPSQPDVIAPPPHEPSSPLPEWGYTGSRHHLEGYNNVSSPFCYFEIR